MKSKPLNIASLIIAGLVALNELQWLGKTKLALVIFGLAVAVGLNALAGLSSSE